MRGVIMVGGQKIQVGLAHARKTVEVTRGSRHLADHRRTRHHHHSPQQAGPDSATTFFNGAAALAFALYLGLSAT